MSEHRNPRAFLGIVVGYLPVSYYSEDFMQGLLELLETYIQSRYICIKWPLWDVFKKVNGPQVKRTLVGQKQIKEKLLF